MCFKDHPEIYIKGYQPTKLVIKFIRFAIIHRYISRGSTKILEVVMIGVCLSVMKITKDNFVRKLRLTPTMYLMSNIGGRDHHINME